MGESISIWLPGGIVMFALVTLSAFFSGSETALFYLSREQAEAMRNGSARERLAIDLLSRPDRLLASILFWNLVVNLTYFAVGILTARRLLDAGFEVAAGVINLVGVIAIIVFGEILPKSLALVVGRVFASTVSFPLAAATRVLDPILPMMSAAAAAVRRVWYPKIEVESLLEPKDLDNAAKLFDTDSDLTIERARVFRNVLDLLDLTAEDLMWPRARFIPLGKSTIDGEEYPLLLAGDVVVVLRPEAEFDLVASVHRLPADRSHVELSRFQQLVYVPWSAPAAAATLPLVEAGCIAVGVVNEYGDVIGIASADDALEPIVNPSASRARRLLKREPIVALGHDRFRVEGMTLLRVLAERLGLPEDDVEEDSGDSRTVAGLIHDRLGRFAAVGDELPWMDRQLTVVKASARGDVVVELELLLDEKDIAE